MADYTPPDGGLLFVFRIPYTPPTDVLTFVFGESAADSVNVVPASITVSCELPNSTYDVIIEIVSEAIGAQATLPVHAVEPYYEVQHEPLEAQCAISCIDVDGLSVDTHQITIVPEIVHQSLSCSISVPESSFEGGQMQNLPFGIPAQCKAIWQVADLVKPTVVSHGWKTAQTEDINIDMPFEATEGVQCSDKIKWIGSQDKADKKDSVLWQDVEFKPEISVGFIFDGKMLYQDIDVEKPWGDFENKSHISTDIGYLTPGAKDIKLVTPWDGFTNSDVLKRSGYLIPEPKDKQYRTYWGEYWYSLLCDKQYYPPLPGSRLTFFKSPEVLTQGDLTFSFRKVQNPKCPWDHNHSGPRDPFHPPIVPGIPPDVILVVPNRGVYYMYNSTFIRRISGNMENIDFKSVTMSIDRDSWLWSFNITILSKESLDLIKPQGNVFTDIEINCNGWKWTCRVENWKENITFGKKSWSVTGKSTSIELGDPYSVIPAYSNIESHGGQIIDSILLNSGWEAEWNNDNFDPFANWLIPAGCLNTTETSALKIIQSITDSVGSFIQTAADTNIAAGGTGSKKLIIRPTYECSPWLWETDITPKVILTDAICNEMGRGNNVMKEVNAVIISGENSGVIVNATRAGTAGDIAAPTVINPLMTTREAAIEKARHIIGKSGFWINHSLRLFSLMPPTGDAPGLLLPGDFIGMNESGTLWHGQITATAISSAWGQSGLETSQSVEVEQYIGS